MKAKRFFLRALWSLERINVFRYARNLFLFLRYPFMGGYQYEFNSKRKDKCRMRLTLGWNWYDSIPAGWRKAFGKRLLKEIKAEGKREILEQRKQGNKVGWKDLISWCDIKQKWGELVLDASTTKEIMEILRKYELMSTGYCEFCGKPARYRTRWWVSYLCERCYEKHERGVRREPITCEEMQEMKKRDRLTLDDAVTVTTFDYEDVGEEEFQTEEECSARIEELAEMHEDIFGIMCEHKEGEPWVLRKRKSIRRQIDLKKEYGIDFESLWGLGKVV